MWFTTNKSEKGKLLLLLISLVQIPLCWAVQENNHRQWWSRHLQDGCPLCAGDGVVFGCARICIHPPSHSTADQTAFRNEATRLGSVTFLLLLSLPVSFSVSNVLMHSTSLCCPGGSWQFTSILDLFLSFLSPSEWPCVVGTR